MKGMKSMKRPLNHLLSTRPGHEIWLLCLMPVLFSTLRLPLAYANYRRCLLSQNPWVCYRPRYPSTVVIRELKTNPEHVTRLFAFMANMLLRFDCHAVLCNMTIAKILGGSRNLRHRCSIYHRRVLGENSMYSCFDYDCNGHQWFLYCSRKETKCGNSVGLTSMFLSSCIWHIRVNATNSGRGRLIIAMGLEEDCRTPDKKLESKTIYIYKTIQQKQNLLNKTNH